MVATQSPLWFFDVVRSVTITGCLRSFALVTAATDMLTVGRSAVKMMPCGEKLMQFWETSGCTIGAGATADELAAFEKRYAVMLPSDVRSYFSTCVLYAYGATADPVHQTGDAFLDWFDFWSIERVRHASAIESVFDTNRYQSLYVFADVMLGCPYFAIPLTKSSSASTPVLMIDRILDVDPALGIRGRRIAPSFADFVDQYVERRFSDDYWT